MNVALRHTTSKIVELEDLNSLPTLGFRGEGLNSLCTVAKVEMVTKTVNDRTASSLVFDNQGMFMFDVIHTSLLPLLTVPNLTMSIFRRSPRFANPCRW